jgi:hypothetical protein
MIASMKNLLVLTVLFASFLVTCLRADEKPLFAPRPVKDPVAIKNHAQGAGIFEIVVDKPIGKVKKSLSGAAQRMYFSMLMS